MLTVITMYRGWDAEMFCQVVEGELTDDQKSEWRKKHNCDEHYEGNEDDLNNMFFCVHAGANPADTVLNVVNVDG